MHRRKKENTTVGDTERRQPNAACITTMWFSTNSPLKSQTGVRQAGRQAGREGRKMNRGAELGETLFFFFLMLLYTVSPAK